MQPRIAEALAAFQRGQLDRSRELALGALENDPSSPELQHLMGLIDCRSGRLDSGAEWLRRASDAVPSNVGYRVMLVRALVDSDRAPEALEVALPPSGVSPPELALWHARAEAATAVEAWLEAAEAWSKLCAVRTEDWRAWSNLANALGEIGRWREAAPALVRAVGLNPGNLALRRNLAGALNNAGRAQESVDEFRRCIDAAPDDKSLRISLAAILGEMGREEEYRRELAKAAELAGTAISDDGEGLIRIAMDRGGGVDLLALRELADLLERTNRIDELARLLDEAADLGVAADRIGYPAAAAALRRGDAKAAKRVLQAESPDALPSRWHWLMARIEDSLGNADAAFAEAEAMNRSTPDYQEWRRRGAEERRALRRAAEAITPEWSAQLPTIEESERGSPVFLVGFPRSGTTLLDTFLRGHPDTEVLEELPLVRAADDVLGDMAALPESSTADIARARGAYFAELDRHLAPGSRRLVIDKMPLNMLAAPVIHSLFPKARLIFAQRHPCDVVLSCFMQAFVLNYSMASFLDISDAADFYDAAMDVWTRSCEALPVEVHTVVYEGLVADPEGTLRPAIEFLGLDWRPELLDHQATARSRGSISTPSYSQVVQPLSRAARGRWRRYEKQLEPVLPILLSWAERLGYAD